MIKWLSDKSLNSSLTTQGLKYVAVSKQILLFNYVIEVIVLA